MAQKSLYDVLLVDQNATSEEIKLAFKRRALQVHPDKGGSKEEFHLVYQALETLGDPAARQKYDHSLVTTKTGPAPHASHAPYPKGKKRKREGKHAQPATSCKAETKTKPQKTPGKKSTTFAGKAPSKPPRATPTSAEPQSKQTKLLMKIRDLLKKLPRDARNDVITNQFSQKQRVILERFMVDNADTSSGTKCHSEAEALAPAATGKGNATNQAGVEIDAVSKATSQSTADSSHGSVSVALPATNCCVAVAKSTERTRRLRTLKKRVESSLVKSSCEAICNESELLASEVEALVMRSKGCNALAVPNSKRGRNLQMDRAVFSKPPAKARGKDRKKTSNNTKMRSTGCLRKDKPGSGSYSAGICFDSLEMRSKYCDLKTALEDLVILTAVKQKMRNQMICTGTFTERLQAALVSSSTEHGRSLPDLKLRFTVFQAAGCFIGTNMRSPSVRSLEVFGKMRSVLEPFRQYAKNTGKTVYWWYSPVHLEDAWERFQSAVAEAWRIAGVDSAATLQKIRSRYETRAPLRSASLHLWERQHMATQDKNKHRRWCLRERNVRRRERWERQQMAMEDKNKHRPKRLRQNLQSCESNLSRQLTALRKLIARWGQMLKREAKLVDKERQKKLRERKAQQKKSQERRRVEVLNEKRLREKERSRREWLRKRMRSDLTMDEILGQKDVIRKTDVRRQSVNE